MIASLPFLELSFYCDALVHLATAATVALFFSLPLAPLHFRIPAWLCWLIGLAVHVVDMCAYL
jgi:hypothetical protein